MFYKKTGIKNNRPKQVGRLRLKPDGFISWRSHPFGR